MTLFVTKYKFNSRCLVLLRKTGFAEIQISLDLSTQIVRGKRSLIFNFESKDYNQRILAVTLERLLNSAYMLDLETECCFFEHREITFSPKKMQKLNVDLLLTWLLPQSTSK